MRKNFAALKAKKESIQDIRVTRKQKAQKIERDVPNQKLNVSTKSSEEKVVRSLRKKLAAIEELVLKQNNGEDLDLQQLAKIDTLDSVMAEIEKFS